MTNTPSGPTRDETHSRLCPAGCRTIRPVPTPCTWYGHALIDALFDRLESAECERDGLTKVWAWCRETQAAAPKGICPIHWGDACLFNTGAGLQVAALERENADWERKHRQRTEDAERLLKERDEARRWAEALASPGSGGIPLEEAHKHLPWRKP